MSVLVYAEGQNGNCKKSTLEAVSYGKGLADMLDVPLVVLATGVSTPDTLFTYGAEKVLDLGDAVPFSAAVMADALKQAAASENSKAVVIETNSNGLYLAPVLAASLKAGYASNVVELPESTSPFVVKRKAFSNKAFNRTALESDIKIIGLFKNTYGVRENPVSGSIASFTPDLPAATVSSEKVEQQSGKVTIADADIVVSGGRGLKGPENWGIIEELADVLGAATACSKPVSDLGWRPHSEHVGQTGKPVASNLYIAVGISGAIQHLAGVNSSKVKVVINTDPEAPFFKAADYGVVGDAFEVVPKLIEKLKEFKATNA
jgi:electron transfer flavoprotein alpha subunit